MVFLVDISGSMRAHNKLALVKESIALLTNELDSTDKLSIVTYAGSVAVKLEPTAVANKDKILSAVESLNAGGSTNGGEGIQLAYQIAQSHFIEGGINRVLMASDGDLNVGITDIDELKALISLKASEGVELTTLGFGYTTHSGATAMEQLADNGNGFYAHIDNLDEAQRVLVDEIEAQLETVAKDTKLQVEFDTELVHSYKLIGYENRRLQDEDFEDDQKDAGDIGRGHQVVAVYEVVFNEEALSTESNPTIGTLRVRYKVPNTELEVSQLIELPIIFEDQSFEETSSDFKFASAVIQFSEVLKSDTKDKEELENILELTNSSISNTDLDLQGRRLEFSELVSAVIKMVK